MPSMRYYPVFLDLHGKSCLVVGAGQVGRRKIATLVECGADHVLVVDTKEPGTELHPLLKEQAVEFSCREFVPEDIEGKTLVIASTDNEEVNWRISRLCAEKNVLCNIVDQPEKCSFILPALYTQGDLTLAVSTSGRSPALSKFIRQEMADKFGPEFGTLVDLMGRLRPLVLGLGLPTEENTRMFASLVRSPVLPAIRERDRVQVISILQSHLPEQLHPHLEGLCDELV